MVKWTYVICHGLIKHIKPLRRYTASQKVLGSIPDVIREFSIDLILPAALMPQDQLSL
jgi:hypothetical protein